MGRLKPFLQVMGLLVALLLFFVSLELMGSSFKLMGRGFAETLLQTTSNPFIGLFIGILATSLVQSSSTITSMTVGIVAGGGLTVASAIPIVMGANIGTSVTNTIVSLGHIARKDEFERAMSAATVHDFFNLIAVALFFPLELATGFLSRTAEGLAAGLSDIGGAELLSPVKAVTHPISEWIAGLMPSNGIIVLVLSVVFLFVALRYLVVLLKALLLGPSERLIHQYLFGPAPLALLFGTLVTMMVQSSSITTSITVPLVGAGIVTVEQIFPFVLGANIGTTVTALLAALVLAGSGDVAGMAALQVAFAHLCFNVGGVLLILPVKSFRQLPIRMAEKLGTLVVKSRAYAVGYIATIFFLIPLLVIFATRNLDTSFYGGDPVEGVEQVEDGAPLTPR